MVVRRPAKAGRSSSIVREEWEDLLRDVVLERLNSSLACAMSGDARPTHTCIMTRQSAVKKMIYHLLVIVSFAIEQAVSHSFHSLLSGAA